MQEPKSFFHAFHLLVQMFPVFRLYDLQYLHGHVRLVKDASGKRKSPEIPGVGVADRQVDIGYVRQPVSVFRVQFRIVPAVENLMRKTDQLASSAFCRVKKLADAYSPMTLPVRSSFS